MEKINICFRFVKDIVTRTEYNDLMKFENVQFEKNFKSSNSATVLPSPEPLDQPIVTIDKSDDIPSTSVVALTHVAKTTEKSNDDIQVTRNF